MLICKIAEKDNGFRELISQTDLGRLIQLRQNPDFGTDRFQSKDKGTWNPDGMSPYTATGAYRTSS